jgi:hypothetical protein
LRKDHIAQPIGIVGPVCQHHGAFADVS